MSRVAMMKEEKESAAFLQFTRIYSKKPACLFCFFEGEDGKYYGIRIKENLSHIEWEGIDCGGKQTVLNVYGIFQCHEHEPYHLAKTAFFVDKDFDEPLASEIRQAVYETPCYSIENCYTTLACFKEIIKQEFKINEFGEDASLFQQCLYFFKKAQQEFHEAIIEFNAWVLINRKKNISLNLRDYDKYEGIKKLVKIEINHIEKNTETFADLFEQYRVNEAEIKQVVQSFSNSNCRCEFRGKQELLFFVHFLNNLKDNLCQSPPPKDFDLDKPRKINFQIPTSNFLSALTQYADTPACLREYLTKFQETSGVIHTTY